MLGTQPLERPTGLDATLAGLCCNLMHEDTLGILPQEYACDRKLLARVLDVGEENVQSVARVTTQLSI